MLHNQVLSNKETKKKLPWILISFGLFAFFCIVSVFGVYSIFFKDFSFIADTEKFGQFGDFIGGTLNPILAFLSFMALLYTIKIQIDELKLSREELEATRKELEGSRIAQQEQSESLKLQNQATKLQMFENTFFKMLDLDNKIVDKFDGKKDIEGTINIRFKDKDEIIRKGFFCKNSFSGIYNEIKNNLNKYNRFDSYYIVENLENISKGSLGTNRYWISKELVSCNLTQIEEIKNNIEEEKSKYPENQLAISNNIYTECMKVLDNYLAHYLRNIYQILKLIDNNDFINDKKFYSNILRAQLNQDEQGILFHNCVSEFLE